MLHRGTFALFPMSNFFPPYKTLRFAPRDDRPVFVANFASTIDGKVHMGKAGYWPIGSATDRSVLLTLRAHADILIHGRNTAQQFDTLSVLDSREFRTLRKELNKPLLLPYLVVSAHPTQPLFKRLTSRDHPVFLATTINAKVPAATLKKITVLRGGTKSVDLNRVAQYLAHHGYAIGLVEGGPHLMGSFLKEQLLDELFLTIAPKIFGNNDTALTMVEGVLLPQYALPSAELVSAQHEKNELFLRYRLSYDS